MAVSMVEKLVVGWMGQGEVIGNATVTETGREGDGGVDHDQAAPQEARRNSDHFKYWQSRNFI